MSAALLLAAAVTVPSPVPLPARVKRIVLHVLGGPSYEEPVRRFVFFTPPQTFRLWRYWRFGAHWIVWTDGSIWPRHPRRGEPASYQPPLDAPLDDAWRRRLQAEAAPVYGHVVGANPDTVGIEMSHSGRSTDPFPEAQLRSVAWLLRSLLAMSGGRLNGESIVGHKDLDSRPAYVQERCSRAGCPVFVDDAGRPYRRRVDPPESLFAALGAAGIEVPRPKDGNAELLRVEAIPSGVRPKVDRWKP